MLLIISFLLFALHFADEAFGRLETWEVVGCNHYTIDGQITDEFPFPSLLNDAKPVIEYMDGWKCDISGCRTWEELPENARKYVEYIEAQIGCHIGYVSVGPERDSIIYR